LLEKAGNEQRFIATCWFLRQNKENHGSSLTCVQLKNFQESLELFSKNTINLEFDYVLRSSKFKLNECQVIHKGHEIIKTFDTFADFRCFIRLLFLIIYLCTLLVKNHRAVGSMSTLKQVSLMIWRWIELTA